MLDISKLAVRETADIHIEDASGEPLYDDKGAPVTITVYGPGSKQFARAQAARNQKLVETMRSKKRGRDTTHEDNADFLADVTVSFNGFQYPGDLKGREQFRACYLDQSLGFIAERVSRELGDWANFTKPSAKN